MPQAEKAIFSVVNLTDANKSLSEREKKLRKSCNLNPITLKHVIDYINLQDISAELKDVLRKKASRYPNQALQQFVDNFKKTLAVEHRKLYKGYVIPTSDQTKPDSAEVVKPIRRAPEPKPTIKPKKIVVEEIVTAPVAPEPIPEPEKRPVEDPFDVGVELPFPTEIKFAEMPPPNPALRPPMPPAPPASKKFVPFSATLNPEDFE
jgi:hypothetical protein